MKFLILTLAVAAVAHADVSHLAPHGEADAAVVRSDSDVSAEGFQYNYETSNGIAGQAVGQLKQVGDSSAVVVEGSNQYTDPEGAVVQLSYRADENGYQPQGAHIPTPHPIPEYIARAIEYIHAHPQKEVRA